MAARVSWLCWGGPYTTVGTLATVEVMAAN